MSQDWQPSNQPTRYDRARAARAEPIHAEIERLGLPLIRMRKLAGILGALIIQIEDGGDNPEVNRLLLEALRAALLHQVGEERAQPALRAIEVFEQAEAERWAQVRAGTLPPIELAPEERLDDLVQEGYALLALGQTAAACDRWLAAWELVKELARPEMRSTSEFDQAHREQSQFLFNWCQNLEMELQNAGVHDPVYHEHRLRYADEFLARFPQEDVLVQINFGQARGEALWDLGRRAEAEAAFAELVERFPRQGWVYISWADQYWMVKGSPKEYARAEEILMEAADRPRLEDRRDVLERLAELCKEWGKA
jgi:tetratricopeptide (TPR) repeat protein